MCKQVPFLRYDRLDIENFKRMNIIAFMRITAFSSLGVAVYSFKMFLAKCSIIFYTEVEKNV